MKYWNAKVKIKTESDNGKVKTHIEQYLVAAVSPTDVEVIINKEFENDSIDFRLSDVKETKIVKVIE